jgi:hypothetical protein
MSYWRWLETLKREMWTKRINADEPWLQHYWSTRIEEFKKEIRILRREMKHG